VLHFSAQNNPETSIVRGAPEHVRSRFMCIFPEITRA